MCNQYDQYEKAEVTHLNLIFLTLDMTQSLKAHHKNIVQLYIKKLNNNNKKFTI